MIKAKEPKIRPASCVLVFEYLQVMLSLCTACLIHSPEEVKHWNVKEFWYPLYAVEVSALLKVN